MRVQPILSAATTAAAVPPSPPSTRRSQTPIARQAQQPKGTKSVRTVRFTAYSPQPRRSGTPIPRNGNSSDAIAAKIRATAWASPAATARRIAHDAKLAVEDLAARRARVSQMHRESFPVPAGPESPVVASTSEPTCAPQHFFADCSVRGFSQPVRMVLDNGYNSVPSDRPTQNQLGSIACLSVPRVCAPTDGWRRV